MSSAPLLNLATVGDTLELRPTGSWTVINANVLESLFNAVTPQLAGTRQLRVDLTGVLEIDTLGAWLLEKVSRSAEEAGHPVTVTGVDERHAELIEDVRKVNRGKRVAPPRPSPILFRLEQAGHGAFDAVGEAAIFLQMLGATGWALLRTLRHPRSLRLTSLVYQTWRIGWQAIPIMVLITFLIGAIIAQQGIFHFRKFGAESYVVDMVGILVLREIGVL
ncbi:MAG: ABC transporter permease, partial [Proteobacteria bacterium]